MNSIEKVIYDTPDLHKPTEITLTDVILVSGKDPLSRINFDLKPFKAESSYCLMDKGYKILSPDYLEMHFSVLPEWFRTKTALPKTVIAFTSYDILSTAVDLYEAGTIKSLSLIRIGESVMTSTLGKTTLTQVCNESLVTAFRNGIELR